MLDINLLRAEKGGNPDLVRESQRRRCVKDTNMVDEVIAVDVEWRQAQFQVRQHVHCSYFLVASYLSDLGLINARLII